MRLKTYHAYSMSEALAAVKGDLGMDAVILHTRTFKRGGFLGIGRKTIIEVTATPADQHRAAAQQPTRSAPPAKVKVNAAQAQRAYGNQTKPAVEIKENLSLEDDRERTRRLAQALAESHARSQKQMASPPASGAVALSPAMPTRHQKIEIKPVPLPAAKRFLLTSPDEKTDVAVRSKSSNDSVEHRSKSTNATRATTEMHDELCAIKQMVGQVLQRQVSTNGTSTSTMPKHLFDMYLQLIAQDISDELADQICSAVRQELNEDQIADVALVRAAVQRHLAAFIPVAGDTIALESNDGRPLTIALIGPTGVGKTTTLAKLAATFKLRYGKTVGLITADTYRIAAVDQLRTYAEIIDLPLHVALTPAEMKRAVSMLSDRDVILVDTAGRSQKDSNRIAELKRFIAAANPHEVHLVLSGTAGEKVLLQEAEAFSAVGVHKIVLTKLDEAVSFGMLVSTIRTIGKQLSFVTTGQEVPDDIEVGRADRLAELVLGAKSQSTSPEPAIEVVKELPSRVPSVRPPESDFLSLTPASAGAC